MLHLAGFGRIAKCDAHEVKTIGAQEACRRVASLVPGFTFRQTDQALFAARNGGAHFALTTKDVARGSARRMVRLLEPLITAMSVDRATFWGDMTQVADTLLDENVDEIRATLEMKFAAARKRLEERLAGLATKERELVLRTLSTPAAISGKDEEPLACPVCDQGGVVFCKIEDNGEPEFKYERVGFDEYIYLGGHIDQTAYGVNFICYVCGLDLDSDEMAAADLPTEYEREARDCETWEFIDD